MELCTGSRLHFGLLELAADQPNRFGGLGLMLERPRLLVQVGPADAWSAQQSLRLATSADSELQTRVEHAMAQTTRALGRARASDLTLRVLECPALHSGLGCGTQLATSVSTALQLALSLPEAGDSNALAPSEHWQPVEPSSAGSSDQRVTGLAALSGRGKRSAIGLHGFLYGGLVKDLGYPQTSLHVAETNTPSARPVTTGSCCFPSTWRIVLITGNHSGDMHGSHEERLMNRAGANANGRRAEMLELIGCCMDAALGSSFVEFTTSLDSYMDRASALFARVQAGPYRDEQTAARVQLARAAGLAAVGQSSWGPTVFGFAASQAAAERAVDELSDQLEHGAAQLLITRAANHGALWRTVQSGVQHAR